MNSPATLNQPIVISQYEKLTTDIAIAEQKNAAATFNYRDPKENKLARSHVFSLRTIKGQIEAARKEAKSYALDYGKRVDTAAKELSDKVEALILPHETEIKKIEAEEQARKDRHQNVIHAIIEARGYTSLNDSSVIFGTLRNIKQIDTSAMEEFKPQADAEILTTIKYLEDIHTLAVRREQEALELARLRKEAAEREENERVERVKREAVELERQRVAEAHAKAEREAKEAQSRKDREAKDKIERAKLAEQQAKLDAERAEMRAKEAEARAAEMAKREQEAKERIDREIAEHEARRADLIRKEQENKKAVTDDIADCLCDLLSLTDASVVADAIVAGSVRHVRVDWEA